MKRMATGFTLIELLVTVVIVAILAAIAYPSYQRYVMRTRRADGQELAMRIASQEERYFTNLNRYTTDLTKLGFTDGKSEKGYYLATVTTANTDQTFVVSAAPQTTQVGDSCGALTINNTGFKDAPSNTGANGKCW